MTGLTKWCAVLVLAASGCLGGDELTFEEEPVAEEMGVAQSALSLQANDFAIVVSSSSRCLEIGNSSAIEQQDCDDASRQLWRFKPAGTAGESVYAITSKSGGVLEVGSASLQPGAALERGTYAGGSHQKFRLIDVGAGEVQLKPLHSNLCIAANSAVLEQATCNSTDPRQRLQIDRRGTLTKKALVVLLENEGYKGGLPFNPGMSVPTGLCFSCSDYNVCMGLEANVFDAILRAGVPPLNQCIFPNNWRVTTQTEYITALDLIRSVTDFVLEEIGAAMVYSAGAEDKYDKVIILQDEDFNITRIRSELMALAPSYLVDVHVLAHGSRSSFGPDGAVSGARLKGLKSIAGLTLRAVFQQNCHGEGLNDEWLHAGAQVVNGSSGINYMSVAYGPFIRRWLAGETFAQAVRHSFEDVRVPYSVIFSFIDVFDESEDEMRRAVQFNPLGMLSADEELAGSTQVIVGNGSLRQ
jgi:hypothetical protein